MFQLELTRLLGAGGFGEVYEADHQLLQQKRAINLLLEHHFYDPTSASAFWDEQYALNRFDPSLRKELHNLLDNHLEK